MARYRHGLPQLDGGIFLSDGGMETTFIFHDGMELPHFASCVLLETPEGRFHLRNYYERYLAMARGRGVGFVLDSATWRANPDWGRKLGYDAGRLAAVNRAAIALLVELRDLWEAPSMPCVISVCRVSTCRPTSSSVTPRYKAASASWAAASPTSCWTLPRPGPSTSPTKRSSPA